MWGEKAIAVIAIFLSCGVWSQYRRKAKIWKLWDSVVMQYEHLGFWSFPIFFWQEKIFPHLIMLLLKKIWENQALTLSVSTRNKTFWTSTTAVGTQQMSKIQRKMVVKLKFIQSLLKCKNLSINLLDSSNHLWDAPNFRVPWSKRSHPFLKTRTQ